jgi:transcriptional regulator with XRE-family HTH domain
MIHSVYHVVKHFFGGTMEVKILAYNGHDVIPEEFAMPMPKRRKAVTASGESFGDRLAQLRQAAGYSQREFAAEVGISQRMVVYYEKASERIPLQLLPVFAKVLRVSSDQLLGIETVKGNGRTHDNRLWRFSQVEKLPPPKRKLIVQILDAFLGSEKAKKNG